MGLPNFRRFDVQARYSLIASLAGLVPLGAAVIATLSRYDGELRAIQFAKASMFRPALFACVAAAMLLAGTGAALGFNSAGQRRNDRQKLSWAGFFLGGVVVSLSVVTVAAFWFFKMPLEG